MTPKQPDPVWNGARKTVLAGLLTAQFALAYVIGTEGLLTNDQGGLFAPIAMTAAIPVALFLLVYAASAGFRSFVLAQDFRILTMVHLWRVIGFTFLVLFAYDKLPALFAWPAGLGDVALGFAAIFVVARMDRNPDYVESAGFRRFHLLGLLDFAAAVGTAGLSAGVFPGLIPNGVTSALLDVWPLNLFPSFLVPAFIIMHLTVLMKIRHMRQSTRAATVAAANPA